MQMSHSILRITIARLFLLALVLFMLSPVIFLFVESVTHDDFFAQREPEKVHSFVSWKQLFGQGTITKYADEVYLTPGDLDTLTLGVDDSLTMMLEPNGRLTVMPPQPWVFEYPAVELRLIAEGLSFTSAKQPRGAQLTITMDQHATRTDTLIPVNPEKPVVAQLQLPAYDDEVSRIRVHYEVLWYNMAYTSQTFDAIWNSIKLAFSAAIVTLMMSTLLAYAFVRLRIAMKTQLTGLVLAAQLFPSFLLVTTYANLFYWLGEYIDWLGRDSMISVFIIYLGSITLSVFLVMGYVRQIDADMEESAFVDGATPFQALWHILLPLSKPILAVTFLISFIFYYSEFNIANRMLAGDNITFAAFTMYEGFYSGSNALRSAMLLVSCFPVLVLFALLRKNLVSGLSDGSMKG